MRDHTQWSDIVNDNDRIAGFARKLIAGDYELPEDWNRDPIQRALSWRPVLSDLIFNYIDAATRCDRQDIKETGTPATNETELALEILTRLIEAVLPDPTSKITVDDIAYHFCARV